MIMRAPQNLVELARLRDVEILKLRIAQAIANVAVILAMLSYLYPILHLNLQQETVIGTLSLYDIMFRISIDMIVAFPLIFIILFIYPLTIALIIIFNLNLSKKYLSGLATALGFFSISTFILMAFYEFATYNTLRGFLDVGITGLDPSLILATRLGETVWLLLVSFLLLLLALRIYSEEVKVKIDTFYDNIQKELLVKTVLKEDKAYI